MRIKSVRAWVLRMPWEGEGDPRDQWRDDTLPGSDYFLRPENGCVYAGSLESMLVKIETDEGIQGWGEAQAPIAAGATAAVVRELLGPLVIGQDPCDRQVVWSRMVRSMATRGHQTGLVRDAMAAVDMAVWDIAARAAGVSITTLLGGAFRRELEAYASGVPGRDFDARAENARRLVAAGFRHFKLVLGYGVREDTSEVEAFREVVGPAIGIYADAHWRYTADEAIRLGRELARLGVGFLEASVPTEAIEAQRRVASEAGLPVALGEEYRSPREYHDRLAAGAVGIAQPDIGRCGFTTARQIADLCQLFHVPVAPHLGVGLGVYVAAALQLAASLPNFYLMECDPHPGLVFANRILREPVRVEAGVYRVPQGPGLGVEVDEAAVQTWAVA